ncbi:MAG: hypothetical protein HYW08_01125 [candidate division NC10 bacterium]|nr:hypothetical protein [candidate division NC10 bacterium]
MLTAPSQIDPEYLAFVWQTRSVRADIERRARTSAGIFKINQANLVEVVLPVAARLEDQRPVVAALTQQMQHFRRLESAVEENLEEIDSIGGALLRRAFRGEL